MKDVILIAMLLLPIAVAGLLRRQRFGLAYLCLVVLAMAYDMLIVAAALKAPIGQPDSMIFAATIPSVALGWIWIWLVCRVVGWIKGPEQAMVKATGSWHATRNDLSGGPGVRVTLRCDGQSATVAQVVEAWRSEEAFRTFFNDLLASMPFDAFRWETRGVSRRSLDQPFEFVVLDSPSLDREVDATAFAEHFADSDSSVVTFPNLGQDAVLVVPCPYGDVSAYGHLAAFVRNAPDHQRHALWQAVGTAMAARINSQPTWLSTAGGGVSWLHVRLDDRPKYYGHAAYAQQT